jgi:hypothetical protein
MGGARRLAALSSGRKTMLVEGPLTIIEDGVERFEVRRWRSNVIELETFARAMGLEPGAQERLRGEGPIDLPH